MLALFPRRNRVTPCAPTSLAEAHRQLAEKHLAAERFRLARRHYRAALRIEPKNGALAYNLALAWEADPYGSDERAYRCYRLAVKIDSSNALYFASLGRAAIRTRRDGTAKKALALAMKLAPADANVLAVVAETLREAGQGEKAWKLVCRARFLAPQDSAIRDLWNRAKFDLAAKTTSVSDDTGERMVLPFLRIVSDEWRLDAGTSDHAQPKRNVIPEDDGQRQ
jgi:tetratricopeptide (TPR) repeat protein